MRHSYTLKMLSSRRAWCTPDPYMQAGAVDKNTGQQANTYVLQRNAGATDTKGPINITHPVTQFRNQVS
jgi:hypothetical protein